MKAVLRRIRRGALIAPVAAALVLTGCSTADSNTESTSAAETTAADAKGTHEVTDAHGTHEVPNDPQRVIATDNTIFQTLEDWKVDLVAAPTTLMSSSLAYKDSGIPDIGSHREPNMELFVSEDPDLVLTGYRFDSKYEEITKMLPGVAVIDTSLSSFGDDDTPLADKLRDQTTLLGEVFNKQDDAKKLIEKFDKAIERAQKAYNKDARVMGLVTSGGDINYAAPGKGRAVGPLFDMIGLTPALVVENSTTDHQGDDISVEAIAESNPDWILVLDRDASTADPSSYTPADELIAGSEALKNVTAVKEGNIYYLPNDFYRTEGIEAYTEALNQLADALEKAAK